MLHAEASAVCPHVPWVHESLVHFTPSSQPVAEQHAPQVADLLSAAGQQVWVLPWHSDECSHLLALHESVVHGSSSLHCESSQHSEQPTPGQHSVEPAHLVAAWSHNEAPQASSVHGSLSSQPALSMQASL